MTTPTSNDSRMERACYYSTHLDEGIVQLIHPESMSADDCEYLIEWLQLIIRRVNRIAEASTKSEGAAT